MSEITCSVADGCEEPASLQWQRSCWQECVDAAAALRQTLAAKRTELEQANAAADSLARRLDTLRGLPPDARTDDPLTLAAELAQRGEQVAGLERDVVLLDVQAAELEAEHTHPMFGCDTHKDVPPGPVEPPGSQQ